MPTTKQQMDAGEKQASARLRLRESSKTALAQQARATLDNVKRSKNFPNDQDVQKAASNFEAATAALEKTNEALLLLRAQEEALLSTLVVQAAAVRRTGNGLLAAVNVSAGGSAQAILEWGLEVATMAKPIKELPPPPENLRATIDRAHKLVIRWDAVIGHVGYVLQFGDPNTGAWRDPLRVTKASYAPEGIALGQAVSVRVAVLRTSGESAFSNAVGFTMR